MQVICHQAISIYFKAFVVRAVSQAIHYQIFVVSAGEYIDPLDNCTGYKIQL